MEKKDWHVEANVVWNRLFQLNRVVSDKQKLFACACEIVNEYKEPNIPARMAISIYEGEGWETQLVHLYHISQQEMELDQQVHRLEPWRRPSDHWLHLVHLQSTQRSIQLSRDVKKQLQLLSKCNDIVQEYKLEKIRIQKQGNNKIKQKQAIQQYQRQLNALTLEF